MIYRHMLFSSLIMVITLFGKAQNVGIGTTNPDNSARLEVADTAKGLLIPRLTESQRNTISNPAQGLLVFVTDDSTFYYNSGTKSSPQWVPVLVGSTAGTGGWKLQGNTGTTAGNHFLGTTDNEPLLFKTNDQQVMLIDTGQHVEIPDGNLRLTEQKEATVQINSNNPQIQYMDANQFPAGDYFRSITSAGPQLNWQYYDSSALNSTDYLQIRQGGPVKIRNSNLLIDDRGWLQFAETGGSIEFQVEHRNTQVNFVDAVNGQQQMVFHQGGPLRVRNVALELTDENALKFGGGGGGNDIKWEFTHSQSSNHLQLLDQDGILGPIMEWNQGGPVEVRNAELRTDNDIRVGHRLLNAFNIRLRDRDGDGDAWQFQEAGPSNGSFFFVLNDISSTSTVMAEMTQGGTLHMRQGDINLDNDNQLSIQDENGNWTHMYANSGEIEVEDAAGNVTLISPHNFSLIPGGPSEPMAWSFYSHNKSRGQTINVDMLQVVRQVERLSGKQLVYMTNEQDKLMNQPHNDTAVVEKLQKQINRLERQNKQLRQELQTIKQRLSEREAKN